MIKKNITYTDYNGVTRTEPFYFNLSKSELMEMEFGTVGGFTDMVQKVVGASIYLLISSKFSGLSWLYMSGSTFCVIVMHFT